MKKKIQKIISEVSVSTYGDDADYFTEQVHLIDDIGVKNLLGYKFYNTDYGVLLNGKEFRYCTLTNEELSKQSGDKNKAWICLRMGEGISLVCSKWDAIE
jgi:hypothetical protein